MTHRESLSLPTDRGHTGERAETHRTFLDMHSITHRALNLENVFLIGTRAFEFKLRKDHLEHTAELQWDSSSAGAHGGLTEGSRRVHGAIPTSALLDGAQRGWSIV